MNAPTRRSRFEERVRIEREFLVPVNRRFGEVAPLAGMTAGAIDSWERRAEVLSSGVDVARAASVLREAASRAELLADRSRDVFDSDRHIGPDGLETLRRMLDDILA